MTQNLSDLTVGFSQEEEYSGFERDANYEDLPEKFVMVVEDSDVQRLAIMDVLRLADYSAKTFCSGYEACQFLSSLDFTQFTVQLILTDIRMPVMDGIELLYRLKGLLPQEDLDFKCKISPLPAGLEHDYRSIKVPALPEAVKSIPVVMMSSEDGPDVIYHCISIGAIDYLVKPVRLSTIKNLFLFFNSASISAKFGLSDEERGPQMFETIGIIGRGTEGVVSLVCSKTTKHKYACKEVVYPLKKITQSCLNEIRLLKLVRGPTITQYYDSWAFLAPETESATISIVMEYCSKGTLSHLLLESSHKAFFSTTVLLDWTCELLLAVETLHAKNVLHRDIKAENIFVDAEHRLKLGDFGIGRRFNNSDCMATTSVGTPYSMSPEVCSGKPYDKKTDIWSLGCVLYQMITRKRPFQSDGFAVLFDNICNKPYQKIHEEEILQNLCRNESCSICGHPCFDCGYKLDDALVINMLCKIVDMLLTKNPSVRPDSRRLMNSFSLVNKRVNILLKRFEAELERGIVEYSGKLPEQKFPEQKNIMNNSSSRPELLTTRSVSIESMEEGASYNCFSRTNSYSASEVSCQDDSEVSSMLRIYDDGINDGCNMKNFSAVHTQNENCIIVDNKQTNKFFFKNYGSIEPLICSDEGMKQENSEKKFGTSSVEGFDETNYSEEMRFNNFFTVIENSDEICYNGFSESSGMSEEKSSCYLRQNLENDQNFFHENSLEESFDEFVEINLRRNLYDSEISKQKTSRFISCGIIPNKIVPDFFGDNSKNEVSNEKLNSEKQLNLISQKHLKSPTLHENVNQRTIPNAGLVIQNLDSFIEKFDMQDFERNISIDHSKCFSGNKINGFKKDLNCDNKLGRLQQTNICNKRLEGLSSIVQIQPNHNNRLQTILRKVTTNSGIPLRSIHPQTINSPVFDKLECNKKGFNFDFLVKQQKFTEDDTTEENRNKNYTTTSDTTTKSIDNILSPLFRDASVVKLITNNSMGKCLENPSNHFFKSNTMDSDVSFFHDFFSETSDASCFTPVFTPTSNEFVGANSQEEIDIFEYSSKLVYSSRQADSNEETGSSEHIQRSPIRNYSKKSKICVEKIPSNSLSNNCTVVSNETKRSSNYKKNISYRPKKLTFFIRRSIYREHLRKEITLLIKKPKSKMHRIICFQNRSEPMIHSENPRLDEEFWSLFCSSKSLSSNCFSFTPPRVSETIEKTSDEISTSAPRNTLEGSNSNCKVITTLLLSKLCKPLYCTVLSSNPLSSRPRKMFFCNVTTPFVSDSSCSHVEKSIICWITAFNFRVILERCTERIPPSRRWNWFF